MWSRPRPPDRLTRLGVEGPPLDRSAAAIASSTTAALRSVFAAKVFAGSIASAKGTLLAEAKQVYNFCIRTDGGTRRGKPTNCRERLIPPAWRQVCDPLSFDTGRKALQSARRFSEALSSDTFVAIKNQ